MSGAEFLSTCQVQSHCWVFDMFIFCHVGVSENWAYLAKTSILRKPGNNPQISFMGMSSIVRPTQSISVSRHKPLVAAMFSSFAFFLDGISVPSPTPKLLLEINLQDVLIHTVQRCKEHHLISYFGVQTRLHCSTMEYRPHKYDHPFKDGLLTTKMHQ